MNLFIKMFITGLLAGFFMTATAGPPDDGRGQVKQVMFYLYCHPDETMMVAAIQKSFHEYISATADVKDGAMKLFLLEDPDDKSMSIMVTQGGESCLIFSGENIQHFDVPAYIPSEGDTDT